MNVDKSYYMDTSALLPYYREEATSEPVQDLMLSLIPPLIVSDLSKVEFASALARWVRMTELSEKQANLIENTFSKDIATGLYLRKPLVGSHYNQAEKWLSARTTSLRTLDALHLACCWQLGATLVTCDSVLHQAADTLGVNNLYIDR